mgnify:FL=1
MVIKLDTIIQAVRANKYIGNGSMSDIDECYSDDDIEEYLTSYEITTPEKAIEALIDLQNTLWEEELETKSNWQDTQEIPRDWVQFIDSMESE